MAFEGDKANITRQYLLGVLPDEDVSRLEEDFFADDQVFEEIQIAEDDLVDAYVCGKLSESDRQLFEQNLSKLPRLAERVKFAEVLDNAVRNAVQPTDAAGLDAANKAVPVADPAEADAGASENILSVNHEEQKKNLGWKALFAPWVSPAGLVTAALLLAAGSFLVFDWWRLRTETKNLLAQQQELQRQHELLVTRSESEKRESDLLVKNIQAQSEVYRAEVERLQAGSPLLEIPWVLYPSGYRDPGSGSDTDLRLPSKPSMIVLRLMLEADDYPGYSALITRVGESKSEEKRNLKSSSHRSVRALTIRLQSANLQRGDYTVTVNGVRSPNKPELVATYSFRII